MNEIVCIFGRRKRHAPLSSRYTISFMRAPAGVKTCRSMCSLKTKNLIAERYRCGAAFKCCGPSDGTKADEPRGDDQQGLLLRLVRPLRHSRGSFSEQKFLNSTPKKSRKLKIFSFEFLKIEKENIQEMLKDEVRTLTYRNSMYHNK